MISTTELASRLIASAMSLVILTGCSGLQPTPMMPTYPARIGGPDGVSLETDSFCRLQAYQVAEKTRQDNINKEVAFTAIGTIAGAVIGNQVQVTRYRGPAPYWPRGPHGHRGWHGPRRVQTHDMAGAGAFAGAATGAALSQGTLQNTQQVYDIYYNNCIERYRAYR